MSVIVSVIFLFIKFNSFFAFLLQKLELEDNVYKEYLVKSGVCFLKL